MNSDILYLVGNYQPITTAQLSEHLETLGYGGNKTLQAFREQISKAACYLKQQGKISGYDVPQTGSKPLRYWILGDGNAETKKASGLEISTTVSGDNPAEAVSPALPEPHQNIQPTENQVPGPEYARTIPTETLVAPNRKTVNDKKSSRVHARRVTVEELLDAFQEFDPPAGVPLFEVFAAAVAWMESRT